MSSEKNHLQEAAELLAKEFPDLNHFQEAAELLAKEFPDLKLPESGLVTLTDEQAKRLWEIERRLLAKDGDCAKNVK